MKNRKNGSAKILILRILILSRLFLHREKYNAIKGELQTEEYKKDTEGLEVYYGKAEPTGDACYHDPLCECDQYGEPDAEDEIWDWDDDVEADIPF